MHSLYADAQHKSSFPDYMRNQSRRFNPEWRRGGWGVGGQNMKGSFLVDSQWIRKQWRSRGCSCVKTSGCITTMPLCSRLLLALNYVSAHSSQLILWTAILGCGAWTRRMAADCWQRAVAYNPSLPIGSACSIRRRKGAEAAEREEGEGGAFCRKKK